MSRTASERLADILEHADRALHAESVFASHTGVDDDLAALAFDALLYDLVVIGEAVNALPADVLDAFPAVPWRAIVGMRNFLAHAYFDVDIDVIRATVDEPVALLVAACRSWLDRPL